MIALGIYREIEHSPNREYDDHEILKATAKVLAEKGVEVSLKEPKEVVAGKSLLPGPDLVFMMCEQIPILDWVKTSVKKSIVVNSPDAVLNTYRFKMVPLLQSAKVPAPKTEFISLSKTGTFAGEFAKGRKFWIKRIDVHNTQKGDVSFIESYGQLQDYLKAFENRGMKEAILQEHLPGDLIKFYGVGNQPTSNRWFRWFYHKNQELKKYRFSEKELREITAKGADALGLEIYGGDAIATKAGGLFLIDINAWPSFALFRDEASKIIADYLIQKIQSGAQMQKV